MRNIFAANRKKHAAPWKILVPALCFAMVFLVVVFAVSDVSLSARAQERATAEEAVRRAAVQCYAIEGRYPQDVAYLQEHYGLVVDTRRYSYHLNPVGENLMPEIFVFPAGERKEGF
ncbi:hypothetical protein [Christensenella tenuis]|uniref:Uncharacterized protein n=1 Tax=Christensenella tenuis TaxID=2763033 RepID=A0ABR7EGX4_9FIRM|nr:hypothetical protein [Christensenella tenuis]MBC5649025.1 hypothetical protein [Christensenella tenuis]